MKRPPQKFFDEYWRMRERIEWANIVLERGENLTAGKLLVGEFRDFYAKWHGVIAVPDLREAIEKMNRHIEESLGRNLEEIYLLHLREVIEARIDWLIGESLLKGSLAFITIMKETPPQLRPELEKIHREFMKKEYDPETYYRDSVAETAESEADFRKALAGFKADWPERVDAALCERLEKLDDAGAKSWTVEVDAGLGALKADAQ